MAQQVTNGAMITCTFGAGPGTLTVLPASQVNAGKMPAATIMEHKPMVNILPFPLCSAPSNPAVIAAMGSPSVCTPMTAAPWTPGSSSVLIGGQPALNSSCQLLCSYGGVITVSSAGQQTVNTA